MKLYSGQPYWMVKNQLDPWHEKPNGHIDTEVVVIGSGITGSLVANELCRAGIPCVLVDKRSVGTGSSSASTALLQYEIDTPMCKLRDSLGEANAALAYRSCLESITDLQAVISQMGIDPSFENLPSLFYAGNRSGISIIDKEIELRVKYGLPAEYLDRGQIKSLFGFSAPCALYNKVSAQMDPYRAATQLTAHNRQSGRLRLLTHTTVTDLTQKRDGYVVRTDSGGKIRCKWVIIATGFEAGRFFPSSVMQLTTTYAIISQPVDPRTLWHERSLIWETRDPYLYIRTDDTNRIIVGGEDDDFDDPSRRIRRMAAKSQTLEKKFRELFPRIPFRTEFSWAGTFSSTRDGLPLIGATRKHPRKLYALGYGGNGITFSMIAAQMLTNRILGKPDARDDIFGLGRPGLNFD